MAAVQSVSRTRFCSDIVCNIQNDMRMRFEKTEQVYHLDDVRNNCRQAQNDIECGFANKR